MINALYNKDTFKDQPEDFRIGAIISDGMWYSLLKWMKLAKVSEPTLDAWVQKHLENGMLLQSPTGARSYRFPLESIVQWHKDNDLELGVQIVDFNFPPRIWGGLTETEGFLQAPLREVSIVSFSCSTEVAREVIEELRGIARVREREPGHYKAYCLDTSITRNIVENIFAKYEAHEAGKIYSNSRLSMCRELVDFPADFSHGLVLFYNAFGKTLVKKSMNTISIFLPDPNDQEAQIALWVIRAIEKFNEAASVPFSAYLNSVLARWPYELPEAHLGKELTKFQRQRSKAIKELRKNSEAIDFSADQLAEEMGVDKDYFVSLEEKHRAWLSTRSATTLTWDENNEEKGGEVFGVRPQEASNPSNDMALAHRLSYAIIASALDTGRFDDAFKLIGEIHATEFNAAKLKGISPEFISSLGVALGIEDSPVADLPPQEEEATEEPPHTEHEENHDL